VWTSDERAPSVVPKLSLATGLVYTYTKPVRADGRDPWYFTAIDFRTGATIFQRLTGAGLGYNNNYAPVTIGPDGSAYVGVLGGLVALRDSG
jgi:outer membrane protein assembly factor BamB